MLRLFFIVECGIIHGFLCAMCVPCVYSKVGHHPHPLGYLCAKFSVFCDLHCWASPWRKIVYSIAHRDYLMPREPKHICYNTIINSTAHLQWHQTSFNIYPPYCMSQMRNCTQLSVNPSNRITTIFSRTDFIAAQLRAPKSMARQLTLSEDNVHLTLTYKLPAAFANNLT